MSEPWTIVGWLLVAALSLGLAGVPIFAIASVVARLRWEKRVIEHDKLFHEHQEKIRAGGRSSKGGFTL